MPLNNPANTQYSIKAPLKIPLCQVELATGLHPDTCLASWDLRRSAIERTFYPSVLTAGGSKFPSIAVNCNIRFNPIRLSPSFYLLLLHVDMGCPEWLLGPYRSPLFRALALSLGSMLPELIVECMHRSYYPFLESSGHFKDSMLKWINKYLIMHRKKLTWKNTSNIVKMIRN